MTSVLKIMKTLFKTVSYAIMNSITTDITSQKCQRAASCVSLAVLDAQC